MADFAGQVGAGPSVIGEAAEHAGAAGAEFVPVLLGGGDRFAQAAQQGLLRRGRGFCRRRAGQQVAGPKVLRTERATSPCSTGAWAA